MSQKIPRPIGAWTAEKLEQLSNYLEAFAKATKRANGRFYIDTMAGCGECVMAKTGVPTLGSAWRALNVSPAFSGVHLVELDGPSAEHLARQTQAHRSVQVHRGDCNVVVPRDVLPKVSRTAPTLAFLDPTGVQISWELVSALARHRYGKKVELLVLFAFDMFINRWMMHESTWPILDRFYGDRRWQTELDESRRLGEDIHAKRSRFIELYSNRLRSDLGYKWVDTYGPLKNGKRVLYHMIFATDDDTGHRIMNDVWMKSRPIPGQLFYQRDFGVKPAGWP